ncbi:DUF2306 domain-containing protein [Rhizohabitans arisaemae]|uniref:DUF2306 domain-containing protein n=1 Tax=Rhizohabitans arisaemae TaxID=2720610 RepID=UPI0024B1B268|nr:DUF2306 domain-containing protein [Rhizohabitans arisaemae]
MTQTRLDHTAPARAALPWWRRPWIIPLALVVALVLAYIWPHYITLDPATATVPVPPQYPYKYPLLVAHIFFGSVALIAAVPQLWPKLRRTKPHLHRLSGRIYVFGGVLPGAVMAAVLLTYIGGPGWMGRIALEVLWVVTTVVGWRMMRKRRKAEHRRWMIYSFALTMDAFTTRLMIFVIASAAGPRLDLALFLETVAWTGWLINLCVAHWWIERTSRPAVRRTASRVPEPAEASADPDEPGRSPAVA